MNEIILAIIKLLERDLGAKYKKYFYWENRVSEQAFFPFIEVIPDTSNIRNRGTGGMMDSSSNIIIVMKTSLKKYLWGHGWAGGTKINYFQDVVKMVEERETDGTFKEWTIMKVLHDNLQLTIDDNRRADIDGEWDVQYNEDDLGESYVLKATIRCTVKRIS